MQLKRICGRVFPEWRKWFWAGALLAAGIPALAQPCVPLPGQIIGWWRAELNTTNTVGTNTISTTGNPDYTSGEAGYCFSFDGSGDSHVINDSAAFELQDLTIEAWVRRYDATKTTAPGGGGLLFSYGPGGYGFGLFDDGHLFLSRIGVSSVNSTLQVAGTGWHHVAVTKSNAVVYFYLDGVGVRANDYDPGFTFTTGLAIGARGDNAANCFLGAVDEPAVFSRALTTNEIAGIRNAGSSGKCTGPMPPVISRQPAGQSNVLYGAAVSLYVLAAGSAPLRYQWSFNGLPLPGATNYILNFTSIQATDAGDYSVKITNAYGAVTSVIAPISVLSLPVIVSPPLSLTNFVGETNAFAVGALGSSPLYYQWRLNGANIDNATNASLVLAPIQPAHTGAYTVVVSNFYGMVTSPPALLVLKLPPGIITQPASRAIAAGKDLTFSVSAVGSPPLVYYWSSGATNFPPATNSDLKLLNVQLADSGVYSVIVSNSYGLALSSNALLSVTNPVCAPPPGQVAAWWRAESNTVDVISGVSATNSGNAAYTNGVVGPAFSYDGNADGTVVGNPASLQLQDFTIEAWIRRYSSTLSTATEGNAMLIGYGYQGYGIGIFDDGSLFLTQTGVGGVVSIPQVTDTSWHHVAVTKSNSTVVIYVDGTGLPPFSYNPGFSFITPLAIGARGDNLANCFFGAIDEPAIFSRALTVSEIAAIYSAGIQGKCAAPTPPSVTWQPADQICVDGASVTFAALAAGTPALGYQWRLNGSDVAGATDYVLNLAGVHANSAGNYRLVVTNAYGSVTSAVAVLTVLLPPTIISQPASITNFVGETNAFTVGVSGTAPFAYQWQFNGASIDRATDSRLVVENIQSANVGSYAVVVTNPYGTVTSAPAALALKLAPVITTQPLDQNASAGINVALSVVAAGTPPLTYYWTFGATPLGASVNPTLLLPNVQPGNAGAYSVLVSNFYGVAQSSNAVLTVTNPVCAAAPSGLVAWWKGDGIAMEVVGKVPGTNSGNPTFVPGKVGQAFAFNGNSAGVKFGGMSVAQLQDFTIEGWLRRSNASQISASSTNGQIIGYGSGGYGVGLRNDGAIYLSHLQVSTVTSSLRVADTNWHHVAVAKSNAVVTFYLDGAGVAPTNYGEAFTFSTALAVGARSDTLANSFLGAIDEVAIFDHALAADEVYSIYNASFAGKCYSAAPPAILVQPADQMVGLGANATFTVAASGELPLAYQWRFQGANRSGATRSSLTLTNVQLSNAGGYSVVITNYGGSLTSDVATLSVLFPPSIATQPSSITNAVGESNAFTVVASGTTPLAFQWRFNGAALADATNSTLIFAGIQTNQAGSYVVTVSNFYGMVTSSPALLVLKLPPTISVQPLTQSAAAGTDLALFVVASGEPPLFYYWSKGGGDLPPSTNASLTLFNLQLTDSGPYSVLVSNIFGVAASPTAILTVTNPACSVPLSGIVGWWRAESNTLDRVTGASGTRMGNATYTNGFNGVAFSFDGDKDGVVVGNPPAFQVSNFTIEAWIRRYSPTASTKPGDGNAMLVGYGQGGYGMGIFDDGRLFLTQTDIGAVNTATPQITDTAWHHMAVTKSNATVIIFVDGVALPPLTYDPVFSFGTPMGIGSRGDTQGNCFLGAIDEPAIYDRPLLAGEIAAIYSADNRGKCNLPTPPFITTQPLGAVAVDSGPASFTVVAAGAPRLNYQWLFSGARLDGATNYTLNLTGVHTNNAGDYQIVVSNSFGSVTSEVATLTVLLPPFIITQPAGSTNFIGETNTFTVTAGGSPPLAYQWRFAGHVVNNATDSSLTVSNIQAGYAGIFTVTITNPYGAVTSAPALLGIKYAPTITTQPQSQSVPLGGNLTLGVVAGGTLPLSYYWKFGTTDIASGASPFLPLLNFQVTNAGSYYVIVSNLYGTAVSSNALLAVTNPACVTPPSGLVFWCKGDGSGAEVVNNALGTNVGNVAFADGKVNKAVTLDGTSSGIRFGPVPAAQSQSFTIETWLRRASDTKSSSNTTSAVIVGYGATGYALAIQDDGALLLAAIAVNQIASPQHIIDTNWHHVAVTRQGSTEIFYVDGVGAQSAPYNPTFSFTTSMAVGIRSDSSASGFLGQIDEVSIYNRVLTSDEILSLYNATVAGKCYFPIPPAITGQPTNLTFYVNTSNQISLSVTGSLPFAWQWQFQGTNLATGTNAVLSFSSSQFSDAGTYTVIVTNAGGAVMSSPINVSVVDAAVITSQPQNANILMGTTAFFQVGAAGQTPLSYQWRFNGTNLPGATGSSLTISNAQPRDGGNYLVVVTNAINAVTSSPALLVIRVPVILTSPPLDAAVPVAANFTFSVAALGDPPLRYQWQFAGTRISGATDSAFTIFGLQPSNAGMYSVAVSNSFSYTVSANAQLTVTNPICANAPTGLVFWCRGEGFPADEVNNLSGSINGNPTYTNGFVGRAMSFDGSFDAFVITNTASLQLQDFTLETWFRRYNTTAVSSDPNAILLGFGSQGYAIGLWNDGRLYLTQTAVGAANTSFVITNTAWHHLAVTKSNATVIIYVDGVALPAMTYNPTFLFTTPLGIGARSDTLANSFLGAIDEPAIFNRPLTSDEILRIYNSTLAGKCFTPVPPSVSIQPANRVVLIGTSNQISPDIAGTLPRFYQWQFAGATIAGATNSFFSFGSVQSSNSGAYTVTVSNVVGTVTSSVVTLTAALPTVITDQPQTQTNFLATTAVFQVGVTGAPPLFFQWRRNDTNLAGATQSLLTVSDIKIGDAGSYTVVISNFAMIVTSTPALLVLRLPVSIAIQPEGRTVVPGVAYSMFVAAAGEPPFTYQWLLNGSPLPGATTNFLRLNDIQPSNGGPYSVLVSNSFSYATSSNAVLTVVDPVCLSAPPGLVAWWQAENTAQENLTALPGTLMGSTTFGPGRVGRAFVFDGILDAVLVGNPAAWQLQNFTIEAWMKRASATQSTGSGSDGEMVAYGVGGYGFGIFDDGTLYLTKVGVNNVSSPSVVTDTNWHHVAVTKLSSNVTFYVDGVGSAVVPYSQVFTFSNSLAIGARGDTLASCFLGSVDEAAIYNRALSSNEIQSLYFAFTEGKCPLSPAWLTQPVSRNADYGTNTTFTALASGTRPLGYQWFVNSSPIAGATNANLTLTGLNYYNVANYNVAASNIAGVALSSNAALAINLPPVIRNGSFETGTTTNWLVTDVPLPLLSFSPRPAGYNNGFGFFSALPVDGKYCLTSGFDGNGPGRCRIAVDLLLPRGPITLTFSWRAGWDLLNYGTATLPRKFSVVLEPYGGGIGFQTNVMLTANPGTANYDTGSQTNTLDLTSFGGTGVRLCFDLDIPESYTGPGFFQLDNVTLLYLPSPPLTIARSGNSVVLSWPAYFTNMYPVALTGSVSGGLWSPLDTNSIVRGVTNSSLREPIGPENTSYRLRSP